MRTTLSLLARQAFVPVLIGTLLTGMGMDQPRSAPPKFEVASIKLCREDIAPDSRSGADQGEPSPGRLNLNCTTVKGLIEMAYTLFENGRLNPASRRPLAGGPPWIESERYSINAKAEVARSQGMMRGPMMQALLEDRFALKIHRETREVPVYLLTVAKGGPKLRPFREGSCVPFDFAQFPPVPPEPGTNYCRSLGTQQGTEVTIEAQATSIDEFCKFFLRHLDRPVIDRSGIEGKFDIHLVYAVDETSSRNPANGAGIRGAAGVAPPDDVPGQSIFIALRQQLGLELDPARGPGEILVIDSVSRPTAN